MPVLFMYTKAKETNTIDSFTAPKSKVGRKSLIDLGTG